MTTTGETMSGETAAGTDDDRVDGRTLRRTRNRTAVITSLLSIIREGDLHPGASEIADRAGVSHRSIFRYFDDLDDLVRTSINHAFVEAGPLAEVPDIGVGPLDERIEKFVAARVALFELVDGAMQLARTRAPTIPAIDEDIMEVAQVFRDQIATHFAAELDGLDPNERLLLVDGLLVATSYDAFTIHLRLLHSDLERIRAAWVVALTAMLN
jgi:AcrR family transcriptional regulator